MSFPEGSWVEVRYPLTKEQERGDRAAWPWLPGWVVSVCGPDEWKICVQTPELAMQDEGETVYPVCFRDASELRSLDTGPEAGSRLAAPATTWTGPVGTMHGSTAPARQTGCVR